jgi:hypothetical protein
LKICNFLNRKLARRYQLWLVRDRFDKAIRRAEPKRFALISWQP